MNNTIKAYKNKRLLVLSIIFLVYILFIKTHLASGNEKSRFATIESLVERHIFIIDDSTFIDTNDKAFINGHFYSDKPPILAILGSGVYFIIYNVFGLSFKNNLPAVVYVITLFTMTITSILMLFFFYKTLDFIKIKDRHKHVLVLTLGLTTFILPYSLVFNNHLITANLSFIVFYFIIKSKFISLKKYEYYIMGLLAGLILGIDLVTGGVFLLIFSLYLLIKNFRNGKANLILYSLGTIIPIVVYSLITISITGDIFPPSMHPEFWDYPGSEFSKNNLTGFAVHESTISLLVYAFHVLFGYRGLFSYTPILLVSTYYLLKISKDKQNEFSREALFCFVGIIIIVLFYIISDKEYGGYAYGMRYFVAFTPILFFFIVFYLKENVIKKRLGWCYFLIFLSFFIALVGVYNPWADSYGYKIFLNLPVPFLNNLRFLIENILRYIS